MYRINNDKRTRNSAGKIATALMNCLQTKPIAKVNVAEIALGASVSRATFYRIFDTPMDVLIYICDCLSSELNGIVEQRVIKDERTLSLQILHFFMDHAGEINSVFKSGRPDILQRSMEREIQLLYTDVGEKLSDREKDYFKHSLAAVLASLLYVWDKNGREESAEELQAMYRSFFQHN